MQTLVGDLNRLYRETPALHARDCEAEGFEWLIVDDDANSVFAWLRKAGDGASAVAVVSNFTPVPRRDYRLPLPRAGAGASGSTPMPTILWRQRRAAIWARSPRAPNRRMASRPVRRSTLPPLATLMFEYSEG